MFITYNQIHIQGINYLTLYDFEIVRNLNQHATAYISVEMTEARFQDARTKALSKNYVTISAEGAGILFLGLLRNAKVDLGANMYLPGNSSLTQYDLFYGLGRVNRNDYIEVIPGSVRQLN